MAPFALFLLLASSFTSGELDLLALPSVPFRPSRPPDLLFFLSDVSTSPRYFPAWDEAQTGHRYLRADPRLRVDPPSSLSSFALRSPLLPSLPLTSFWTSLLRFSTPLLLASLMLAKLIRFQLPRPLKRRRPVSESRELPFL